MNSYPAAIVWDLDGTLLDSAPDLARVLNTLLSDHGCARLAQDQVRNMIGGGVAVARPREFGDDFAKRRVRVQVAAMDQDAGDGADH